MSFTGRPSSPPLALMSASQICAASSAALPLGASGPVRFMLKPMVSGLFWAIAGVARPAAAPAASLAKVRRWMRIGWILPTILLGSILARLAEPRQGPMIGQPGPFLVAPRRLEAVQELDGAERPAEDMGVDGDVEAAGRPAEPRPVADDALEDAGEGLRLGAVADVERHVVHLHG